MRVSTILVTLLLITGLVLLCYASAEDIVQDGKIFGVYDGNRNLTYYMKGEAVYDTQWGLQYYIRNNTLYDKNWQRRYFIKGDEIYNEDRYLQYWIKEYTPPE